MSSQRMSSRRKRKRSEQASEANPLSPPSAPAQRRLQGPPAKSNFLAVKKLPLVVRSPVPPIIHCWAAPLRSREARSANAIRTFSPDSLVISRAFPSRKVTYPLQGFAPCGGHHISPCTCGQTQQHHHHGSEPHPHWRFLGQAHFCSFSIRTIYCLPSCSSRSADFAPWRRDQDHQRSM